MDLTAFKDFSKPLEQILLREDRSSYHRLLALEITQRIGLIPDESELIVDYRFEAKENDERFGDLQSLELKLAYLTPTDAETLHKGFYETTRSFSEPTVIVILRRQSKLHEVCREIKFFRIPQEAIDYAVDLWIRHWSPLGLTLF